MMGQHSRTESLFYFLTEQGRRRAPASSQPAAPPKSTPSLPSAMNNEKRKAMTLGTAEQELRQ
jgi:hypothetical protein